MNNNKYRIMYIQKTSGGGSTISLYELIRSLDKNLYEPVVIFDVKNDYYKKFKDLGIHIISKKRRLHSDNLTSKNRDIENFLKQYKRWLANFYSELKPFYMLAKNDLLQVLEMSKIYKKEAIDLVHYNNNLLPNRGSIIAAHFLKLPQVCHMRMFYELKILDRYLARYINKFFFISTAIQDWYLKNGICSEKGTVVFNPINEDFSLNNKREYKIRKEFQILNSDFLVCNIGRLDLWKGHDYFLKALSILINCNLNIKALIVGKVELSFQGQSYYEKLRKMIIDLNLEKHVNFLGHRDDVEKIMRAADIVVHSASKPEPFGRVIAEAMMTGRPVIATAAGGVMDIIKDKITGLLVPPKDANAMANAIKYLIKNPEIAKKMGQFSQKIAKDQFSVKKHVTEIQKIYKQILNNSTNNINYKKLKKSK